MITVRKYEKKDKEQVRQICLDTTGFDLKKKNMKEFLYLMYNDYYTEAEPDCCFVAENEDKKVVGYLLCAKDYKKYKKTFKGLYLPEIDKLGVQYALMARSEMLIHDLGSAKYQAHLHIDLTKYCRRQGVGSRMIAELKQELLKNGIHSIMLSCGSSNKTAVNFYKKNGFKTVFNFFGSNLMACEF
ncbi:MAG: GNAT family N-acetyltransferase [Acutalibacteraceae bacterium]